MQYFKVNQLNLSNTLNSGKQGVVNNRAIIAREASAFRRL